MSADTKQSKAGTRTGIPGLDMGEGGEMMTPGQWEDLNRRKGIPLGLRRPIPCWYAWRGIYAYRDLNAFPLGWEEVVGLLVPVYSTATAAAHLEASLTSVRRWAGEGILRPLPRICNLNARLFAYTEIMRVRDLHEWKGAIR